MIPAKSTLPRTLDGRFVYMGEGQKVPNNIAGLLIHSSVRVIPRCAFEGCHNLSSVEFQEGVVHIEDSAFSNCTNLESVHLCSSVETIGIAAFLFCLSLQDLTLNDGLAQIGCAAFCGCISLTKVSLPRTVSILQEGTFMNCAGLKEAILPEGLISIGAFSFGNCGSLLPLPTLPESIGSIGYQAFPITNFEKDIEHVEDTKPAAIATSYYHQVNPFALNKGEVSLDHVKVNARRELELHSLQDQLEQFKLENAQLVTKLEGMMKQKDALELEVQCCKQAEHVDDDDFSEALSAAEELISVEDEMVASLTLDDQDLVVQRPYNLTIKSKTKMDSSPPSSTCCGSNIKSCLHEMKKLLGAASPILRLPMKKFAEVDACMDAHHRKMMERRLEYDGTTASATATAAYAETQEARVEFQTMQVVHDETKAAEEEEEEKAFNNDSSTFEVFTLVVDEKKSAEARDEKKSAEARDEGDDDNEDDWIADGFC
ncbi:unnamed protein product [Cylindrotheca closterium]|uniref:Leucine-rich repeat protein n=1 Tax=Cylindrotheca closterium TaxID=2856 RepID=A0AAD2G9R9_9STRA|nr:unnamed protein product [Cylindrotheca closterium]